MATEQETTKAEKIEKGSTIGKAALISILSPLFVFSGIGAVVAGATGYLGAREYEFDHRKDLGLAAKLGYTLISAAGLGIINPYTFDAFKK